MWLTKVCKPNREEDLTKYPGSIYRYVMKTAKIGRANDEKGGEQAGKAKTIIKNENETHSSCECLILMSKIFKYSLHLYLARNMFFIHFKFL